LADHDIHVDEDGPDSPDGGAGRGQDGTAVAMAAASPGRAPGQAAPEWSGGASAASTSAPAAHTAADTREQELLDRLGPAVVRLAVETIRAGDAPDRPALAAALARHSGVLRLRELIAAQLACRADALKARSVLLALETLVRTDPPPAKLLYRLDRIRSTAYELTEIDVVDALRADELNLPDEQRRAAEQLLGAAGSEPHTRLGLAPNAGRQEVVRSAEEQLRRWQQRAASPGAGHDVRAVAGVIVQTCERLLARATDF
jgi:hypothetical protein